MNLKTTNKNYSGELSKTKDELQKLRAENGKKDNETIVALKVYRQYEVLKMEIENKEKELKYKQVEADKEKHEYEEKKKIFEGHLEEIKNEYNILVKLILIVCIPIILASILMNGSKTKEILDFFYYITIFPCQKLLELSPILISKMNLDKDIFTVIVVMIYLIIFACAIFGMVMYIINLVKNVKSNASKLGYRQYDETLFLEAIFFMEFVVIVYVNMFFFIPVNKCFLYLVTILCTCYGFIGYKKRKWNMQKSR